MMKKQTVAETLAECIKIRPALEPLLTAFEPLFTQRHITAKKLEREFAESGIIIPASHGDTPLLPENLPRDLGTFFRSAAQDLLPLLAQLEPIAPARVNLETLFLDPRNDITLEALIAAMLADDMDELIAQAEKFQLDPQILEFCAEFIVSTLLRGLRLASHLGDFPDWHHNVCPVCGEAPVMAWLARKPLPGNNEFLVSGGGKKFLHCGMCGADWHFIRGVCPSCGTQGQDAMQILGEENRRHERIDWCKKCRAYLPQVDLREIASDPDMDAMALGLMHLDLVAKEKNLVPLKPSFWNIF